MLSHLQKGKYLWKKKTTTKKPESDHGSKHKMIQCFSFDMLCPQRIIDVAYMKNKNSLDFPYMLSKV